MRDFAKIAAVSLALLGAGTAAANATCEDRKMTGTVLGAAGGGVIGGVITHGSPIGILGGAALGGFGGHRIAGNGCAHHVAYYHHRHYYTDKYGHRHYYTSTGTASR